jgi:hypothetical protein
MRRRNLRLVWSGLPAGPPSESPAARSNVDDETDGTPLGPEGGALHTDQSWSKPLPNLNELKQVLLAAVPVWTAEEWAAVRGLAVEVAAAQLAEHESRRRVFSICTCEVGVGYPCFQFREDGEPVPGIARVLSAFPSGLGGWPMLSWFAARNWLLDGEIPAELVQTNSIAVMKAAERFYGSE